jgi:hypothetical protein
MIFLDCNVFLTIYNILLHKKKLSMKLYQEHKISTPRLLDFSKETNRFSSGFYFFAFRLGESQLLKCLLLFLVIKKQWWTWINYRKCGTYLRHFWD